MILPIYALAEGLIRPTPQYGAARGAGIARLAVDEVDGGLSMLDVTADVAVTPGSQHE